MIPRGPSEHGEPGINREGTWGTSAASEAKPIPTVAAYVMAESPQVPAPHLSPSREFHKEEMYCTKGLCASCHMCYLQTESHFESTLLF